MKNDLGFYEIINHRRNKFRKEDEEKEKFFTYGDLFNYLKTLTEDQLKQTVQILSPTPIHGKATLLEPGIGINTVKNYCHDGKTDEILTDTRSIEDFAHHPEQIVILRDGPCFDEHGNTWFTLEKGGGMRGNKTGKLYFMGKEVEEK
jgi:hypothetical protein